MLPATEDKKAEDKDNQHLHASFWANLSEGDDSQEMTELVQYQHELWTTKGARKTSKQWRFSSGPDTNTEQTTELFASAIDMSRDCVNELQCKLWENLVDNRLESLYKVMTAGDATGSQVLQRSEVALNAVNAGLRKLQFGLAAYDKGDSTLSTPDDTDVFSIGVCWIDVCTLFHHYRAGQAAAGYTFVECSNVALVCLLAGQQLQCSTDELWHPFLHLKDKRAVSLGFHVNENHFMALFIVQDKGKAKKWLLYAYDGQQNYGRPVHINSHQDLDSWFGKYTSCSPSAIGLVSEYFLQRCMRATPMAVSKLKLQWYDNVCAAQTIFMALLVIVNTMQVMELCGAALNEYVPDNNCSQMAVAMKDLDRALRSQKFQEGTTELDLAAYFEKYLDCVLRKLGPTQYSGRGCFVSMELVAETSMQLASGRSINGGSVNDDLETCKAVMLHRLSCGSAVCDAYLRSLHDCFAAMVIAMPLCEENLDSLQTTCDDLGNIHKMLNGELGVTPELDGRQFWRSLLLFASDKTDSVLNNQWIVDGRTITCRTVAARIVNLAQVAIERELKKLRTLNRVGKKTDTITLELAASTPKNSPRNTNRRATPPTASLLAPIPARTAVCRAWTGRSSLR